MHCYKIIDHQLDLAARRSNPYAERCSVSSQRGRRVPDGTLDYCTAIRLLNIGWIWPGARVIVSGGCSLRIQCDRRVPNGTLDYYTESDH